MFNNPSNQTGWSARKCFCAERICSFKLFLVQSVLCDDWTCDAEAQKFLGINFSKSRQRCGRFMPGKLCGIYSVGSDAWCWANVCGGICRWWTCMSRFNPDGPGQCSWDRWGRRTERFLVLTTGFPLFWHIYCSLNLLHLFFLHLYSMFWPDHCLRFTVFSPHFLSHPYSPTLSHCFEHEWNCLLLQLVVEWIMIFFLNGCRGNIVVYGTMFTNLYCILERTHSSDKVLVLAVKAEENRVQFLSRKLVQAHKIHCTYFFVWSPL